VRDKRYDRSGAVRAMEDYVPITHRARSLHRSDRSFVIFVSTSSLLIIPT